ncbi:MAG: chemotaxis protein CheW [Planctomycetota bacterium]|jgi:chemotaxis signal transduction protein
MRELTLFSLGKTKYGIWQDEVPVVKDIGAIHWLPPVPRHIAGLTILDGHSLTLFDLPACIGLSPISKEKASYPVLLVEHGKNIAGFMVDFIIGHFSMASEAVYPMPDYLRTPIIDTCAMYDSELIPIINTAKLFKRALQADFEPSVSEFRICGIKPEKISSIKTVRVFESGGESFAVCGACIEKAALKPGRVTRPPLLPSYVGGVTFNNGNPITLIHLSSRLKLAEKGTWQQMLVADIGGQGFGLLVDSDRGQWDDANLTFKPVPPLAQSDWIQGAALDGKEIIPVIELVGLMSDQSGGSGEPPFPQRYTPDARFKSLFGREEVKVLEFSLLGVRHALPQIEVEDHFRVKPYRHLPNVVSIVAGVAEHAGELLPVLDLAACFGRRSTVRPDWLMILVKNGDFRALVLTETIFGERLLPVMMHRGLPFDEPHTLVYGCYPDESIVRLVLNVEALAVHFDKVLYKEFFAALSKQMPLEPIEIEFEPEPEQTKVGRSAEEALESPVPETPKEPLEPDEAKTIAAVVSFPEVEDEKELQEPDEIVPPEVETSEEPEKINITKETSELQESQKIKETEAEAAQASFSEEIEGEREPEETEVSGQAEEAVESRMSAEPVEPQQSFESAESMTTAVALTPGEAEVEKEIRELGKIAPPDAETVSAEPEEFDEPIAPAESMAAAAASAPDQAEEKKEIRELVEIAPPDEETFAAEPEEMTTAKERSEIPEAGEIVEAEAQTPQTPVSEESMPEPQPPQAEVSGQEEEGIQFAGVEESAEPEGPAKTMESEDSAEEPEERNQPEESIESMGIAAALALGQAEEKTEIRELGEPAPPDEETAALEPKKATAAEEKGEIPEVREILTAESEKPPDMVSEEIVPEPHPLEAEVSGPVEQDTEPIEPAESETPIWPEEAPETTAFVSLADNAALPAEAADDYSEVDAREKPKRRRASLALVALLLIGFLTATLYFFGGFESWMFRREYAKPQAPVAMNKPKPSPAKHSKPLTAKKSATEFTGSKIAEVKKEDTAGPAATNEPKPSLSKPSKPPAFEKSTAVSPSPQSAEAQKVKSGELTATKLPKSAPAKHQKPPALKVVPTVSPGAEVTEAQKVKSGEVAKTEEHKPAPGKASKPSTLKMAPAVPLGSETVEAKKGRSEEPAAAKEHKPVSTKFSKLPTPTVISDVSPHQKIAEVKKEKTEKPATAKVQKPVLAKPSKQQAPKKSLPISPVPEVFEVKKGGVEESAAAVRYDSAPIKSPEPLTPTMSSSDSPDLIIHDVKKGDTLWDISRRYTGTGFSYPGVAKENKIPNPDLIYPKQKIWVKKKYKYEKHSFKDLSKKTETGSKPSRIHHPE